ncbi:MAG: aryl-sulfate sulfotransferase, partial [Limisphaerales bacterium]
GLIAPFEYQFQITASMPGAMPLGPLPAQVPLLPDEPVAASQKVPPSGSSDAGRRAAVPKALLMPNGVSVPKDFPNVVITVNTNPSPGYLFLETGLDNGAAPYTVIMDNDGLPVWYRRGRMYDFKVQQNGMITWCLSDDTGFPAFDQDFNYLKTYLTTNGYSSDGHELKILADGSYFMIGYRTNTVDMGQYVQGGVPSIVRETVVQGFTPEGDLIFQWRAWDNYDLRDASGNTDFPHMNGIDIDEDGNVLVSARHLSEVTKIDRNSGDIIWRLSGAHSTFSFVNDTFNGTSFQHNISALGNGRYMVFDNGNYHTPQVSRAVEYQLDLTNKTATVVWQFRDNPDKYAYWLGNAQRLPSGNTLINFVRPQYPKAIEVDTNGVKHFELSFVPGSDSYRAFRLPWSGVVAAPYLIIEPQSDSIALLFNKFGDTHVAYYRIYGGTSPQPTTVLAESDATLKNLSNLQNGLYYFRVTAVSTDGTESPFSNEESVNVNITPPGQNLVLNGDFSQRLSNWGFHLSGTANATVDTPNEVAAIYITNGGSILSDIQLTQGARPLVQG